MPLCLRGPDAWEDNPKKRAIRGCQHDKPVGRSPTYPAPTKFILKSKYCSCKLTGIWKIGHTALSSQWPTLEKITERWTVETERDVARRTGREDEKLCQDLKTHFFWEMVSGSMHRVKTRSTRAQAAILAVSPFWGWWGRVCGGGGFKVHKSAGTHHFLFLTAVIKKLLFFFHTVYLWSVIYYSVDKKCKHPHNLEQKSLLPVVIFTMRTTILRRGLVIKASDGVSCSPTGTVTFSLFLPVLVNISTLDSVISNKQENSNNHCDIFHSLPLSPFLTLTWSHTAHSSLYRASYMGKVDGAWKVHSVDPDDKLTNWVHLSRKISAQMWSWCGMQSLMTTPSHPQLWACCRSCLAETPEVLLQIFSAIKQNIS